MNLLIFTRDDNLVSDAMKKIHRVITASPNPLANADITYDPDKYKYSDIQYQLPRGFSPDAILLFNLDYGNFVLGLEKARIPVVAPISDTNICIEAFLEAKPFVDYFICNEERQNLKFKELGFNSIYLPWFCLDTKLFFPNKTEAELDVVFCGNLNPNIHKKRGILLEKLLSSKNFNSMVFTEIHGAKYANYLSKGRIVFNYSVRNELNQRVYEALGLKRLLLTEDSNEEILKCFNEGQHLVVYNEANLIDKINYYLNHSREREDIAQHGYEECMEKHTDIQRANELSEILEKIVSQATIKEEFPEDALYRSAARILLHHGRIQPSLRCSEISVALNDDAVNRMALARNLGAAAFFSGGDNAIIDRFFKAKEIAIEKSKNNAFCLWNQIELRYFLGKSDISEIRNFINELEKGNLSFDKNGPIPVKFDDFRLSYYDYLFSKKGDIKTLLLSRAYEILGDVEQFHGKHFLAIEAFYNSLKNKESGILRHKLGSVQGRHGKREESFQNLKESVNQEPFLFAAKRDLAAIEIQLGRKDDALNIAENSIRQITSPFEDFLPRFIEIIDNVTFTNKIESFQHVNPIFWEGALSYLTGESRGYAPVLSELKKWNIPIFFFQENQFINENAISPENFKLIINNLKNSIEKGAILISSNLNFLLNEPYHPVARIYRADISKAKLQESILNSIRFINQLWVENEFQKKLWIGLGISPQKIKIIPFALSEHPFEISEHVKILNKRKFNFLSIFPFEYRKGWDILIEAFLNEFKGEDVALILKIQGKKSIITEEIFKFIENKLKFDLERIPEIIIVDQCLSNAEIKGLYKEADAYVLPSRFEGFGKTYLEALIAGLPTIGTNWGGHLDFLNNENGFLINIEGFEIQDNLKIAIPSVSHLRSIMRKVFENPEEGKIKARRSITGLFKRYNVGHIANLMIKEINHII